MCVDADGFFKVRILLLPSGTVLDAAWGAVREDFEIVSFLSAS